MRRLTNSTLSILLAASLFGVGASDGVYADNDGFTDRSIKGKWGITATAKFLSLPGLNEQPAAASGVTIYDGWGGCEVSLRLVLGSIITPDPEDNPLVSSQCTYSVNADGTGTQATVLTLPIAPDNPITFRTFFVLVDEVNELPFVISGVPHGEEIIGSGTAQRIGGRDH